MNTPNSTSAQQTSAGSPRASLPPPSVAEAVSGGLPSTTPLATVVVPAGANLQDHDLLIVKWVGSAGVGTVVSFPLPVASGAAGLPYPYAIHAPAIAANDGLTVDVSYEVLRGGQSPGEHSMTLELPVGGSEPTILPPPTVDHVLANGLDPADAPDGTNVRVKTTYPGAIKGDSMYVAWTGKDPAGSYDNTFGVTPGPDVVFPIPVQYITGNESAEVTVSYRVNRADGTILYGPALTFRILVTPPTTAPAPTVTGVINGTLPGYATNVVNIVPATADLTVGDVLAAYWTGTAGVGSPSFGSYIIRDEHIGRDFVTSEVPSAAIAANVGDTVNVKYVVTHAGRPDRVSASTSFAVAAISLPQPSVDEAVAGSLPSDANTATVRIDASADLRLNDLVTVHWVGKPGAGTVHPSVTVSVQAQALAVPIPATAIAINASTSVGIYYSIQRASNVTQPDSPTYSLAIRDMTPITEDFSSVQPVSIYQDQTVLHLGDMTLTASGSSDPGALIAIAELDSLVFDPWARGKCLTWLSAFGNMKLRVEFRWRTCSKVTFGVVTRDGDGVTINNKPFKCDAYNEEGDWVAGTLESGPTWCTINGKGQRIKSLTIMPHESSGLVVDNFSMVP